MIRRAGTVLATALNAYASTTSLGGSQGAAYGSTVSATRLGARSFGVGRSGAAFGVANSTKLEVFELLWIVNKRAVGGVMYNGDTALQDLAADAFERLNDAG